MNMKRGRRSFIAFLAAGLVALSVAPAATAGLLVTATDDGPYAVVHDRVLSVSAPGLLANDSGVAVTAAKRTNPAHGTVTVNLNGSFTYTPSGTYGFIATFSLNADPVARGSSGQRSFFTNQSAVIRANATAAATSSDNPI